MELNGYRLLLPEGTLDYFDLVDVKESVDVYKRQDKHRCASEGKIYDICEFIHDIVKPSSLKAKFPHKVSLQNSCHGVDVYKRQDNDHSAS